MANSEKFIYKSKSKSNIPDFAFTYVDKQNTKIRNRNEDIVTKDDLSVCSLLVNESFLDNGKDRKGRTKNVKRKKGDRTKISNKLDDIFGQGSKAVDFVFTMVEKSKGSGNNKFSASGNFDEKSNDGFIFADKDTRGVVKKSMNDKSKLTTLDKKEIKKYETVNKAKNIEVMNEFTAKNGGQAKKKVKLSSNKSTKPKNVIKDKMYSNNDEKIEDSDKNKLKSKQTEVNVIARDVPKIDKPVEIKNLHELCHENGDINLLIDVCTRDIEDKYKSSYITGLRHSLKTTKIRQLNVQEESEIIKKNILSIEKEKEKWTELKNKVFDECFMETDVFEYEEGINVKERVDAIEEEYLLKISKINFFKENIKYYIRNVKDEIENLSLKIFNLTNGDGKLDPIVLIKAISKSNKD